MIVSVINGIETGAASLIILFGICLISLLWPLLVKPFSLIQLLGMLINNGVCIGLLLLIKKLYLNGNNPTLVYPLGSLYLEFKVSNLGLVLSLLIGVLWPIAYIYSWGYLKATKDQQARRFLFFLNASISIAIMVSFTGDLMTMFCCYELLTLSTIPLIAHHYTAHTSKSLYKYIIYLLGLSVVLWLPAIFIIKNLVGKIAFVSGGYNFYNIENKYIILLIALSLFGIAKSAYFPIYGWLPAAMVANYPVSALLHAVAVVKVGLFCVIKVLTEIFGLFTLRATLIDFPYFKILAAIGVIISGFLATRQNTVKKILAYSTISQMNMMLITILMLTSESIQVAVIQMIMHSFVKITLFFICGYVYLQIRATRIIDFRGMAITMPYITLLFILTSICLIGLPISSVSFSKKLILNQAIINDEFIIIISMMVSSIFSFIYMSKIIMYMFLPPREKNLIIENKEDSKIGLIIGFSLTLIMTLLSSIMVSFVKDLIE